MHLSVRSCLLILLFVTSACANRPTIVPTASVLKTHPTDQSSTPTLAPTSVGQIALAIRPTLSPNRVHDFQYTPDGFLLLVTEQSLMLFDTTRTVVRWSTEITEGCCDDISITAELMAVIAGSGASVHVLDTASGQELYALQDTEKHFSTIAFSRNGKVLATGEFAQIRLWDSRTGRQLSVWQTGDEGFKSFPWTKGITNLAFTLDDNALFSANWWTGQVMKWDLSSASLASSFGLTNTLRYQFSPDAGQLLVDFNQYGFEIRDPQTGALETVHDKIIGASGFVVFSSDGKRVAVWGYNTDKGSTAAVWELETDKLVQEFSVGNLENPGWSRAAFSPDGSTLALSDERGEKIVFFDITTGKETDCVSLP